MTRQIPKLDIERNISTSQDKRCLQLVIINQFETSSGVKDRFVVADRGRIRPGGELPSCSFGGFSRECRQTRNLSSRHRHLDESNFLFSHLNEQSFFRVQASWAVWTL